MKIIIDNSNLMVGGGMQVAASFLRDLKKINSEDEFHILQSYNCAKFLGNETFPGNFKFYFLNNKKGSSILQRIKLVKKNEKEIMPDCIFTLFGPSYHKSKFPKIVGFAIPFIVYPDSPFFENVTIKQKIYYNTLSVLKTFCFKKFSDVLIFETEDARQLFTRKNNYQKKSYTVGNSINEIFFNKEKWVDVPNNNFAQFNILFLTANYPHKNMKIIPGVISILVNQYKLKDFKFLISLTKSELNFPSECDPFIEYLGQVELEKIPSLYNHCDISFIPTLLEVFSTTYLEAMLMRKPILASDMSFSRDICGDAALFCDPVNAKHYAEAIVKIMNDVDLRKDLINKGSNNLKRFGSSMERTESYLKIINKIVQKNENTK